MSREGLSKKIRFEVFKRDSFTCQYCGKSAPNVVLHVDHITPVSKDGDNDITNLITACFDCNMGKKDRELSDDAVVQKRKKQLDELQERREQLEMMVEWQRGLIDISEEEATAAIDFVNDLMGIYSLNDHGESDLKKTVKKYGLAEVLESARLAADQYLEPDAENVYTSDSVDKMIAYIPRICNTRRREKAKPYLNQLYYIRGIIRNRFNYHNDWAALDLLEKAYLQGEDIDDLKQLAIECTNWSQWRNLMEARING